MSADSKHVSHCFERGELPHVEATMQDGLSARRTLGNRFKLLKIIPMKLVKRKNTGSIWPEEIAFWLQ